METSAKTGFNSQKVFVQAAKVLYLDYLQYKDKVDKSRSSSLNSSAIIKRNTIIKNQIDETKKKKEQPKEKPCAC